MDYEVFPGNTYKQETLNFPTLSLPTDGKITVNPGRSFPDFIQNVNISNFPFDLP